MDEYCLKMDYWYKNCPGSWLLQQEKAALAPIIRDKLGDVLFQFGGPSDLALVSDSPIKEHFYCAFSSLRSYLTDQVVVADEKELPFVPSSIDMAVIVHLLSFIEQPEHLLQQLYHALAPEGCLVVLGFNAKSVWGAARRFRKDRGYPWVGQFYSVQKVCNWLKKSGFSIEVKKTLCFRPPFNEAAAWRQWLFLETLGPLVCPHWGGVYLIVARKRYSTRTPIGQLLTSASLVSKPNYPEPTTMKKQP